MVARDETTRHGADADADTAHVTTLVVPEAAGGGERDAALEGKRAIPRDEPVGSALCEGPRGEEAAFGWTQQVDATTGRLCFVHSYTGEVCWPNQVQYDEGAAPVTCAPAIGPHDGPWSPWNPHLVMLPTGIVPMQSRSSRIDSWRGGYARYPMFEASWGVLEETCVPEDQAGVVMQLKRRVLPCTWEASPHGPPFLEPFPVVVLSPVWMTAHPEIASYPTMASDAEAWWPSSELCYSAFAPQVYGDFAQQHYSPTAQFQLPVPETPCQPDCAPYNRQVVEKAHNRRGYGIRQARKLMKELGIQPKKPTKLFQVQPKASSPRGRSSPQDKQLAALVANLQKVRVSPPVIQAN